MGLDRLRFRPELLAFTARFWQCTSSQTNSATGGTGGTVAAGDHANTGGSAAGRGTGGTGTGGASTGGSAGSVTATGGANAGGHAGSKLCQLNQTTADAVAIVIDSARDVPAIAEFSAY
jgi:hypothetical protein